MKKFTISVDGKGLVPTLKGETSVVTASKGVTYVITETATGKSPKTLVTKKNHNDLEIYGSENDTQPEMIIQNFETVGDTTLAGCSTSGFVEPYVTSSGSTMQLAHESTGFSSNALALGLGAAVIGGVAAAGGGGGSSSSTPTAVTTTINGTITAGQVIATNNLSLAAYKADGSLLGSVDVNNDGTFTIRTQESYSGLVLLKVIRDADSIGDYMDEATGQAKDLGADLRAVVSVSAGGSYTVHITPLTELVVRELNVQDATLGATITTSDVTTASTNIVSSVNDLLGTLGFDRTHLLDSTTPLTQQQPQATLTATGTANTSANTYGQVLAILSGADSQSGGVGSTLSSLSDHTSSQGFDTTAVTMLSQGLLTAYASNPTANPTPTVATYTQAGYSGVTSGTLATTNASLSSDTTAPTVTSGSTATIAENSAITTVVYDTNVTDASPVAYTLGGTDAALFAIDRSTGEVTFKATPDFEQPQDHGGDNTYDITVTATDARGNHTDQNVAITVTDVTEGSTDTTSPVFTSGSTATIAENSPVSAVVYTALATDNATVTYTLSGTDAALFTIDSTSGAVSFRATPDYEAPSDSGQNNVYDLIVTATDTAGNHTSHNLAITVTDVNETSATPTISITDSYVDSAAKQNHMALLSGTTTNVEDGRTVTLLLNNQPWTTATVSHNAWLISFDPLLFPNATYQITANVSNASGVQATQATGNLVVDSIAPTFTSSATASLNENSAITTVVYDAEASDNMAGAITYSLGGVDASKFTIDSASGEIRFITSPDYEAPTDSGGDNDYSVIVTARDLVGNTATRTVDIAVTDIVDSVPPTITITSVAGGDNWLNDTEMQLNILTISGTTTNVQDGQTVTLKLGSYTAMTTVTNGTWSCNYSAALTSHGHSYAITANVHDSSGVAATQAWGMLFVDTVNPVFISGTSQANVQIAENSATTSVVYTADATDDNGLTYTLAGADATQFAIDASSGEVTFVSTPDYEAPRDSGANNSYDFTVIATDSAGNQTSKNVTVNVTDVAEVIPSYTINGYITTSGVTAANLHLITPITVSGHNYYLLDADGNGTYAASGDNIDHNVLDTMLNLGSDTSSTDAERTGTFVLANGSKIDVRLLTLSELASANVTGLAAGWSDQTYWAADKSAFNTHGWYSFFSTNSGYTTDTPATKVVALEVLGQESVAPVFSTAASWHCTENTQQVYQVEATDNQSAHLTYAITGGADASLFTINSATGMIFTATSRGLDYESYEDNDADNTYELNVTATDSSGNVVTQNLSLILDDYPETYTFATSGNIHNTIDLGGMKLVHRMDDSLGHTWFVLDANGDGSLSSSDMKDHQWLDQLILGNSAIDTTNSANPSFTVTTTSGTTLRLQLAVSTNNASAGDFVDYLAQQSGANATYWTASQAGYPDVHYSVSMSGNSVSPDSNNYYVAFQVI